MMQCSENGKGYWIEFANGYAASVQWSHGNYCDNGPHLVDRTSCKDAECFIMRGDRCIGDPRPWQTPEQVAAFIAEVASMHAPEREYPAPSHMVMTPALDAQRGML